MAIKNQSNVQILDDSDRFWDSFWQHIDKAQDLVFITTYDMDHKLIAGITLQKLTNAAARGVKSILIIDDLNYYASEKAVQKFRKAGGILIRNNPLTKIWEHIVDGRYQKFFNRNHQKVMLVDSHVFCGSLNVANPYSGDRYGDGSFRDLNIILRNQDAADVRSFFLDLCLQNEKYFPEQLKGDKLLEVFEQLNQKYANVHGNENFKFLREEPPKHTAVTSQLLDMINKAEHNIKII